MEIVWGWFVVVIALSETLVLVQLDSLWDSQQKFGLLG
jgi:hypothetical protein